MSHDIEPSENGELIFDELPSWMPVERDSGNFKLLDVIGKEADRIEGDLESLDKATTVQDAETTDQLQELSELVQLCACSDDTLESYRAKTIGEFQKLTSEGTPKHILKNAATLLKTDPKTIGYNRLSENGAVLLKINESALEQSDLGKTDFSNILDKHSAAGFRVDASLKGTFTHITPSDSTNGNHDSTRGYDGLDADGNPKGNGGTYSGLI